MTFEECLQQYDALCRSVVKHYFADGGTWEDLLQEARIALWEAWKTYDDSRGASFLTFASVIIRRKVQDAVTAANCHKRRALHGFVPLECVQEPECVDVYEESDALDALRRFSLLLTDIERKVMQLRAAGYDSYADIAGMLEVSYRTVDNAYQRAKKKLACSRSLVS